MGPKWGLASVGIYLLPGALGLPVFAGGPGAIGRIFGPTGGYLIGFLPAVFCIGFISQISRGRVIFDVFAMIAGSLIIYAIGVLWLKTVMGISFYKALRVGMFPFLPGDAVKIIAAIPIARALRPHMEGRVFSGSHEYS